MKRLAADEEKVKAFAEGRGFTVGSVFCFDRVDSTMDVAFHLYEQGAGNRSIVLSREQKRGRGRFGKRWISTTGGLYVSIILRVFDYEIPYSMVASYGVYRALHKLHLRVTLKWINDVLSQEGRKIAGVLSEEREGCTAIGVGVNLNTDRFPPELEGSATSYVLETGKTIDPVDFLCHLLEELFPLLDRAHGGEIEQLMEAWEREASLRGRMVRVVGDCGEVRGVVTGIHRRTGALLVAADNLIQEVYGGNLIYC